MRDPGSGIRDERLPWLVRGDVDGFFGLAIDNLVQLLLIDTLCRGVLGFSADLVYGHILPGAAISILLGNVAYAMQAKRLAERTGRTDVCALPYGINTVSLFAHVFLVMLPAKALAIAAGAADPARVAWQAGLFATFCSGVIELACAPIAERVRKATPRAALLSTLAGIALSFISLGFLFRTFARPIVGLTTLAIVMLTYFGRVRFKGRLPGGVLAVSLGTLLAWLTVWPAMRCLPHTKHFAMELTSEEAGFPGGGPHHPEHPELEEPGDYSHAPGACKATRAVRDASLPPAACADGVAVDHEIASEEASRRHSGAPG